MPSGARAQKARNGDLSVDSALSRILSGTGFSAKRDSSGALAIVRDKQAAAYDSGVDTQPLTLAQAAPARSAVETVTVTSSKLGGADVQSIPIAITALSQEQLTATQMAGGPDLSKQVPNMTFTKTNFTGYNIQIRGIGTQAISVTTDPAVAVAFNDMPFIRNHFFEQEFYDVSQVEVLRGPQGTLYGRNATAGVVNLTSAKPTDQFEAMATADIGNYKNRRFEGMINLPIVDDRLDIRLAGEWTKRDGYSFNAITDSPIDGRDLWSSRATIRFKPTENLTADFVWEHFQENDDRMRSSKQLCKRDNGPDTVYGYPTGDLWCGIFEPGLFARFALQPGSFSGSECILAPVFRRPCRSRPGCILWHPDKRRPRCLCQHGAIDRFAGHRIDPQPRIQREEQCLPAQCRLRCLAISDIHLEHRIQQRFSPVDRRLQSFQHATGHIHL